MARPTTSASKSGPAIDVLIPAIEKDLGTLPFVIDGIRKHVRHPIGQIAIVAPDSAKIKALCRRKGCTFVHERSVLPLTKRSINYRSSKWERSGWMLQQLLKLSGDKVSTRKHYLVVDADTVFIRPHRFSIGGKTVFYCRDWSQPEYFKTYKRLLGQKAAAPRSFVTHYMLFDKSKLRRLKKTIEARHGKRWYKAILGSIDRKRNFAFSEYETYGNFLYSNYPGSIVMKSCLNKGMSTSFSRLSAPKLKKLAKSYRSLSFHKRSVYARRA
ncbi:DUF6492 family protein [Paenibacillus flagellatus]|uniref:Glycosyl transferase n=1 Tax=Paenibacillus flagellatus TaxID=2211139 RepID=A0A2V5KDF4_9BACL|nr:DUF6492 family protein [Paenibacillus flagellatus]PYI56204.1 hypothetical protein DLM86_04230 [Paenibacillus flagellatus]